MNIPDYQDELIQQVVDLNEKAALAIVRQRLEAGHDPYRIIELCKEGVHLAGVRYEQGEYFVAGLIMAGVILRNVIDIIQPELVKCTGDIKKESIIIGTVRGDIHDIGKNLGGIILTCEGFRVVDLGVDTSETMFIEAIKKHQSRIVVLSCLLTTAFESLKATIDAIEAAGLRNKVAVLIAGSLVTERVCQHVGADHWTNDAVKGVQWCKRKTEMLTDSRRRHMEAI